MESKGPAELTAMVTAKLRSYLSGDESEDAVHTWAIQNYGQFMNTGYDLDLMLAQTALRRMMFLGSPDSRPGRDDLENLLSALDGEGTYTLNFGLIAEDPSVTS